MESDSGEVKQLTQTLESLRQEMARLRQRTESLEKQLGEKLREATQHSQGSPAAGGLNEELVLTISAAVAAYLGVRPHIRGIRLLHGNRWEQQGRVTIQASHALTRHHG